MTHETLERAEPIRAYRAWFHQPPAQSAQLESFGGQMIWIPRRWMRAECSRFGPSFGPNLLDAIETTHAAPESNCRCGIYSAKDLAALAALGLVVGSARERAIMI